MGHPLGDRALTVLTPCSDGRYHAIAPKGDMRFGSQILNSNNVSIVQEGTTSSASGSGILTLNSTGNGTKTTVAAVKNLDFIDAPEGAGWATMGFDMAGSSGGYQDATTTHVHKTTDATFGASCRIYSPMQPGGFFYELPDGPAEHFPLLSIDMPNTQDVCTSFFFKQTPLSGNSIGGLLQTKIVRSGYAAGATHPNDQYGTLANRVWPSLYGDGATGVGASYNSGLFFNSLAMHWNDSTSVNGTVYSTINPPNPVDGQWHYFRTYYRYNDVGSSNAELVVEIDGIVVSNITGRTIRDNVNILFTYVQLMPGIANAFVGFEMETKLARVHVDSGRAGVFLGNASSLSACTKRIYGNPSTWSDSGPIIASGFRNLPSEFQWAYRTTPAGVTNLLGYTGFSIS